MDLVKTYQKRLQDGIAAVEHDITARTQQIEGLTKRLEGLKRALELFRSDQAAITELLRTSIEGEVGPLATQPAAARPAAASKVSSSAKLKARVSPAKSATAFAGSSRPPRQLGARAQKAARTHLTELREANRNGKVKRTALIAAVLQGTPELTVQESHRGPQPGIRLEVHREQPHRSFVYQSENVHSYRGLIAPARIRSGGR
jgi:hypothetical protein